MSRNLRSHGLLARGHMLAPRMSGLHMRVRVDWNVIFSLPRWPILSFGRLLPSPRVARARGASAWGTRMEISRGIVYRNAASGSNIRRR